jgi:protein-tyrosine-phosphatase
MPTTVLFLCDDNARLGPMAEAYLNRTGQGRVRAFSAGLAPAPALAEHVSRVLAEAGVDDAALEPKSFELFSLPAAPVPDVVVGLTPASLDATRSIWPEDARLLDWRSEAFATGNLVGREALRHAFRRLSATIDEAMATGQFLPRALAFMKASSSAA